MKTYSICLVSILFGACVSSGDDEEIDIGVGDSKADGVSQVNVRSGHTVTVTFQASGGPLEVEVDCGVSADSDVVGMKFTVAGAAVGQPTASAEAAGYWQWSGDVDAGSQRIKLRGKSGSGTCAVRVTKVTGSCTESSSFHSPETGHTHLRVGTTPVKGDFPASGNHWGAWAKWNTVYEVPVMRGWLMHNLEHGGLVLSYGCASPSDSAECKEAADNLVALRQKFGKFRVIVTPDPTQPSMYGVRAWRYGFQSECFDEARMLDFMQTRFRHGREDLDANPPIAFDPSTEEVPCQDLMAAPDSCN